VVLLENDLLRVVVLPQAGGRIWRIVYKPLAADLLWHNPKIPLRRPVPGSQFDDVWSGGWDEIFPNDEKASINGQAYPDHGELWSGNWDYEPFHANGETSVRLSFNTAISRFEVEKTIILRRSGQLRCNYRFTNNGSQDFPFLWKLHPAFRVTPQHRIDFPQMQVVPEPTLPGTLAGAAPQFAWPYARFRDREIDLRLVPPAERRELYFFYGTQMESGWCAITDTSNKLSCGLRFDPKIFSSCCVFARYGGWRDYNVAVLEPSTGYPVNFVAMRESARHLTLAPGETLNTEALFAVRQGISSVVHIDDEGTMMEESATAVG
jgi:galactose mutarotase-like enzyme